MTPSFLRAPIALLIFFGICLGEPPSAHADSLEDVVKDFSAVEKDVKRMRTQYVSRALMEKKFRFAARLTDAQAFYLSKDYDRAAMVLLDLVEDPKNKRHPAYRDGLFYLAESLFHLRNFKAAITAFTELSSKGNPKQRSNALARLLEIAARTGNRTLGQRFLPIAERTASGSRNPVLLYGLGKYLFQIDRLDASRRRLEQIPRTAPNYFRARYFLGTVLVRQGKLSKALDVFTRLMVETTTEDKQTALIQTKIKNMSMLAAARIQYERSKFDKAIDMYNQVPRNSSEFDSAIYESVWVAIKRKAYTDALKKLELLLVSKPNVLDGPDAHLLQGKLQLMLNRYETAEKAFEVVAKSFGVIEEDMLKVVRKHPKLEVHFGRVIGARIAEFDLRSLLPPSAARVVQDDAQSGKALELVRDVAAQRRDVDEANRTMSRLRTALEANNRAEMFPKLNDGLLKAQEYRARILVIRARLNELAGDKLDNTPPQYTKLRRSRIMWQRRFEKVPQSYVKLKERDANVDGSMSRLDQATHRMKIELRNVDAQLIAIRKFLRETEGKAKAAALRQLKSTERLSKDLKAELRSLMRVIEDERIKVGVNDYAGKRDDEIYKGFKAAIESEAAWLAGAGSRLGTRLTGRFTAADRQILSVQSEIMKLVDDRVAYFKRQLASVRKRVSGYEARLGGHEVATQNLGGTIAARSFRRVLGQISQLVLEADVGLIDVTWKMKSDKSKDITTVLDKQRAEFENLDKAFSEVKSE